MPCITDIASIPDTQSKTYLTRFWSNVKLIGLPVSPSQLALDAVFLQELFAQNHDIILFELREV